VTPWLAACPIQPLLRPPDDPVDQGQAGLRDRSHQAFVRGLERMRRQGFAIVCVAHDPAPSSVSIERLPRV
jgi:hypothetical protein